LQFAKPEFTPVTVAGATYSRISMEDAYPAGDAGEPSVPSYGVPFALPPGTRAQYDL